MKENSGMEEAGELSILKELSDRDLLTGLFRQEVFERKTRETLKKKGEGTLLLLSIPGLSYINRTEGFRKGDRIFQEAGGIIMTQFCDEEITGRMENGDIMVFLPEVSYGSGLMEKIQSLEERFRKAGERLKLSVPLTLAYGSCEHSGSYEDMISEAQDALMISKGRAEENMGLTGGKVQPAAADRKLMAASMEGDPMPIVTSYHSFTDAAKLMKKILSGTGKIMNLVLITLTDKDGKMLPFTRRLDAMSAMRSSLMSVMQPGETAADYSSCQYALILLTESEKETEEKLRVLSDKFTNVFPDGKDIKIDMDRIS